MTPIAKNLTKEWIRQHGISAILVPLCVAILSTMLSLRDGQARLEAKIEKVTTALGVHQEQQEKRSVMLRQFHETVNQSCMKCPSMTSR